MIQQGWEHDRYPGLSRGDQIRWWLYIELTPGIGRPAAPRQGVIDRGFHFARGGRCETEDDARWQLIRAREAAEREWRFWQHQPSHMLGPAGELIPLDEVLPEREGGSHALTT